MRPSDPTSGRQAESPLPWRTFTVCVRRPARTYERKKTAPRRVLLEEANSPLVFFFTGGLELDPAVDLVRFRKFTEDFLSFLGRLQISSEWGRGVELKFRRLGRHRADGLYYPLQRVLALDVRTWSSFAHEFGHLMDYASQTIGPYHRTLSSSEEFVPVRCALIEHMQERARGDPRVSQRRGRLSWQYFASAAECFARAFEQFVAESLPGPSMLVHAASRYRSDPLFFPELPEAAFAYFGEIVSRGPLGGCQGRPLAPAGLPKVAPGSLEGS